MGQQEEFVPLWKALEITGLKKSSFFYYVDTNQIATLPGRSQRDKQYKLQDILQVVEKRRARKRKPEQIILDWIQPQDIPVALKLLQTAYSQEVNLAEAAVYQSWRKNNNLLTMGAFSRDRSECYASLQLVPLDEQVILDVLAGRREENSILPDEVRPYDQPGPYTLLATSAVVLKTRPLLLYEMLSKYMQYWIDQYPERYIQKIYAQAVSERGAMLVAHIFMAPRPDLAYNAFELDFSWPATSRVIRKFKQQLEAKAPLPPELQWPPAQRAE